MIFNLAQSNKQLFPKSFHHTDINHLLKVVIIKRVLVIIFKAFFSVFDIPRLFLFILLNFFFQSKIVLVEIDDRDRGESIKHLKYAQVLDSIADDLEAASHFTVIRLARAGSIDILNSWRSPISCEWLFLLAFFISLPSFLLSSPISLNKFRICLEYSFYRILINILMPKFYISTSVTTACCAAFYSKNIPTYDIQHGVIGTHHPYYYRDPSSLYLSINNKYLPSFPANVLVWDDIISSSICYDNDSLIPSNFISVGNPWWLRSSNPDFSQNLTSQKEKKLIQSSYNLSSISICYTTQPFKLKPIDDLFTSILHDLNKKFSSLLIIIRPHPVVKSHKDELNRLTAQIEYLSNSFTNVKFIVNNNLPLSILSPYTDLHITFHSTCVVDFSFFGVSSICTSSSLLPTGARSDSYHYLREKGIVYVATSSTHLLSLIDVIRSKPQNTIPRLPFASYDKSFFLNHPI